MLDATAHGVPQQEIWRRRRSACRVVQVSDAFGVLPGTAEFGILWNVRPFFQYTNKRRKLYFPKTNESIIFKCAVVVFILNTKEKVFFLNPSEKC